MKYQYAAMYLEEPHLQALAYFGACQMDNTNQLSYPRKKATSKNMIRSSPSINISSRHLTSYPIYIVML